MKKRFISALLAVLMVVTMLPVTALGYTITNINASEISTALNLIDKQNFSGSGTTAANAKNVIQHFISKSSFAAIGGGKFPYPNSGSFVYSVSDGTYSRSITGAKGCMAYCNFLERVVYGREGSRKGEAYHTVDSFKTLLQRYAQAGEHIRIDNTHSLTFISCDNDGFYCFSYNGDSDPYIKLQYRTYASVINNYSGKKIWIYDDATAENSGHTHAWTTTTQNDAYTHNKVCSCGAVIGQEAHDFGFWVLTKNATEQSNGTWVSSCMTCGYKQTVAAYRVSYNANGGFGEPDAQTTGAPGFELKLSSKQPTRDGYVFLGWSTSKDATSVTYLPGDSYTANAGQILYAVWISEYPENAVPVASIKLNGHTYYLYDTPATWEKAESFCEQQGGHLATITSSAENIMVRSLMKYEGSRMKYFIGGSDVATEGQFAWVTGEDWNYTNWDEGEPNNSTETGQDYLQIYNFEGKYGLWDDVDGTMMDSIGDSCSYRGFIMEIDHDHEHNYENAWHSDATNHWHECACGAKSSTAAHSYKTSVTAPTSGAQGYTTHTCTVCGYSYRDQYTDKIPAAPTVTLSNVASTGKIKVSWDKVSGAAKYEVYRATSKSGTYSRISTTTKTSVTNTNNVTPGKTYYYKVRALNAAGIAGKYSEIKSRTCDYAQPTLSVTLSSGKPKLTWDKVDGASKYEVYRSTSKSGTYSKITTTSNTSVTDSKNLTAGTTYYYKVRAIGSVSEAASAYSTVVNCTMPLAAPVVKVSNDAATGNIKLSWDKVNGAAKYQVYRATSKSGTYSRISTTTKTSVTNTNNVTPGKTYYYKVRALDANGKAGAYSDVKSRTCDYAQPTVSVALSSGKPKLTWDKVDGASKYEVWRATSKTGTYDLLKTTTGTSLTNTSAKKGTTYYYKVRAIGSVSGATSAYSTVVSIKATK